MKLKDFAKAVGLSQTTVSRALGGYPEVTEKTRKRVAEAAIKYGYVPNTHATSLSTGSSKVIACVVPVADLGELMNPLYGAFMAGVSTTCGEYGFEVSFCVVPDTSQAEACRAIQSRANVGGLILQSPRRDDIRIPMLNKLGMPFVVHGRSSDVREAYSWLDVNNRRAIERATDFLIDLGHNNIGLINGPHDLDFSYRREMGYRAALATAGIAVRDDYIVGAEMTADFGYRSTLRLLDLADPPTALIVSSVVMAGGVKEALDERKLQLGRDISVLTFDDGLTFLGTRSSPPLFTAVRSSIREAGERITRMLISQIAEKDFTPRHELLEAELIVGRSTRARR